MMSIRSQSNWSNPGNYLDIYFILSFSSYTGYQILVVSSSMKFHHGPLLYAINLPCLNSALGVGLLLNVVLSTSLASLSLSMKLIVVSLTLTVTSQAGNGTANGALDTVTDTRTKVVELTLGLLLTAIEVLLTTRLLQGLDEVRKKWEIRGTWISTHLTSEDTTDGLLGRAGSLVPRTLSSVGVIPDSSAGAGERGAGQFGGRMGGIILGLGLLLADITLGLVASVASDAANSALDGTGC